MAWPSGPMVEGMSGLRKLAKERSVAEAGAQNISSSDCSSWGFLALLKPRSGEASAAVLRVFGPKVFSGPDFLLRLGGRSGDEAGARQGSSSNSHLPARGFLLPVKPRPGVGAAPGLRVFLSKGLSDGDFLLLLDGRSVAEAGARKVSSSDRSARGFLVPGNARPGAESAPGLRVFLPTGFSCGDLLLPREGRRAAEGVSGLLFRVWAGFREGFFLLTDKGSPREKKGKK